MEYGAFRELDPSGFIFDMLVVKYLTVLTILAID